MGENLLYNIEKYFYMNFGVYIEVKFIVVLFLLNSEFF